MKLKNLPHKEPLTKECLDTIFEWSIKKAYFEIGTRSALKQLILEMTK